MGTRFLCTREAPVHQNVKQRIVEADERETDLIFRPLRNTARVARNSVSAEVITILASGGTFDDIKDLVAGSRGVKVFEGGDTESGIWTSGMVQGLIHDIPSVAELVARTVSQAESIITSRLAGLIR
jgi:nitronate monooxygenase